jgi:dihydrofolate synthase/folylpolyglutamate synthase
VLREAVEKDFRSQKKTLILGILEDKDWREICDTLAPLAGNIFTVPVSSNRTADARALAEGCRVANPSASILVCHSLAEALKQSAQETLIIVTGSLYLVGETLELLGYFPSAANERELNEWNGKPPGEGQKGPLKK